MNKELYDKNGNLLDLELQDKLVNLISKSIKSELLNGFIEFRVYCDITVQTPFAEPRTQDYIMACRELTIKDIVNIVEKQPQEITLNDLDMIRLYQIQDYLEQEYRDFEIKEFCNECKLDGATAWACC